MSGLCVAYFGRRNVFVIDALKDIGHDVIEYNKSSDWKNADLSIIWHGARIPRNILDNAPRPRVLLWREPLIPNSGRWWEIFCGLADLWDLVFVHYGIYIDAAKLVFPGPVLELPQGTVVIPQHPIEFDYPCFIGGISSRRGKIIASLRNSGIKMDWYEGKRLRCAYTKDGYFSIIQKYPINLNIHANETIGGFETRLWDSFSVNRLLISEPMEDTNHWATPGVHYVSVPIGRFQETITYFLEHPKERDKIANAGYQHGLNHSWNHRMASVIDAAITRKQEL